MGIIKGAPQQGHNVYIMTPVHVDTELNGADLDLSSFKKILARGPFEKARNRAMVEHNVHHDE